MPVSVIAGGKLSVHWVYIINYFTFTINLHKMNSLVHSPLGGFHLTAAMLSVLLGTYILFSRKGSRRHTVAGYAYSSAMFAANLSAFGLYGLFGHFGPFHFAAIISLLTLIAGIIPAIFRRSKGCWLRRHMYWMHYSVFGLYAAFVSEVVTRIPSGIPFFWSVGLGTAVVMYSGARIIKSNVEKWVGEAKAAMREKSANATSLKI